MTSAELMGMCYLSIEIEPFSTLCEVICSRNYEQRATSTVFIVRGRRTRPWVVLTRQRTLGDDVPLILLLRHHS